MPQGERVGISQIYDMYLAAWMLNNIEKRNVPKIPKISELAVERRSV